MLLSMDETEDTTQPAFNCGFPNAAADAADVPLDLNKLVVRHPASTFYMRIAGNSWENLGVNQGDILVIDRSLEPKANDLAVITDGEDFALATIPAGQPPSDGELSIWGIVIWVVHERRRSGK